MILAMPRLWVQFPVNAWLKKIGYLCFSESLLKKDQNFSWNFQVPFCTHVWKVPDNSHALLHILRD